MGKALGYKRLLDASVISSSGEVSEWLKEHAWKACVRAIVPRVRIPLSPFFDPFFDRIRTKKRFFG